MKHLLEVYVELHDAGVKLYNQRFSFSNEETKAVTIETGGTYGIFINGERIATRAEEAVTVAHEAGHCMTGSTHALSSPYDLVQRHEVRANRWAYKKLVPEDELNAAVKQGITEPWELAEYFGVTEAFIKGAVAWYQQEQLAL